MFRENFHGLEKRTDFAFDKERLHNVAAIENFGPFMDTTLALPNNFQGPNYSEQMMSFPLTSYFVSSRSRVSRFALRLGGGSPIGFSGSGIWLISRPGF